MIFVNSNGKYTKKNSNPYTVYPVDAFRQTLKDCGNKKTIFKYLSGFFIYTHIMKQVWMTLNRFVL